MQFPKERPDTFNFRVGAAVGGGYLTGAVLGGMQSNWSDIPLILRDKPFAALVRTGQAMNTLGVTFAAIGASYSLTEYAMEQARRKKDWRNGAAGGVAAGVAMGLRNGFGWRGTAGMSMLFALCSMVGEVATFRVNGYFDDGLTPVPKFIAAKPRAPDPSVHPSI